MYMWIAGHGSWIECFIGTSGSNSMSDQTLEFEFVSNCVLSKRNEILDSEMGLILEGYCFSYDVLDLSASVRWYGKDRETHGTNE